MVDWQHLVVHDVGFQVPIGMTKKMEAVDSPEMLENFCQTL
jgi:hypothetical protein